MRLGALVAIAAREAEGRMRKSQFESSLNFGLGVLVFV